MNSFWSFVIGFFAGFLANYCYDYLKKLSHGKEPFVDSTVEGGLIKITGQFKNTTTGQATLTTITENIECVE